MSKFCTKEEHEAKYKELGEQFQEARNQEARTSHGTQKLHAFQPVSQSEWENKLYSKSLAKKKVKITHAKIKLLIEDMKGYAAFKYDDRWYWACILQTPPEISKVRVSFLQPPGPSPSFCYPTSPDILDVQASNVPTLVDPTTSTGRTYRVTERESERASRLLGE